MTMKRITVAQHERALVWKNKTFAGVLEPGKHWLIAPMSDVQAQLYDLTVPEFDGAYVAAELLKDVVRIQVPAN